MTAPRIHICFLIDRIDSSTAGTEKQLLLLLKNLNRDAFSPTLCVLRPSLWLSPSACDCRIHHVDIGSLGHPKCIANIIRFSKYLRSEEIDILQTFFVDANKVGCLAARLARGTALISTRRNQGYWHTPSELRILRFLDRRVTVFLANSHSTKDRISRIEEIAPERIEVIHNGIDVAPFMRDRSEARVRIHRLCSFEPSQINIGIVANLRPTKCIDMFLRAAAIVNRNIPETRFTIVGEGPERGKLEALASELGIGALTRFLGSRQDIPEVLSAFDVGVLSSTSESLSNALIEYQAAGLPIVCTDVGGNSEIVDEGVNGYLIPAGDFAGMARRLEELIRSGRMAGMGQDGRSKTLKKFDCWSMLARHENLYKSLVPRHAKCAENDRANHEN